MTQAQFNIAWGGLILAAMYAGLAHLGLHASWVTIARHPWHELVYQPVALVRFIFEGV